MIFRRRRETHEEQQERLRWKHFPAEMAALAEHDLGMVEVGGHFDGCPTCGRARGVYSSDPRAIEWVRR